MDNWKKRWEKFMFTEDMVVGGNTVLNPKPETYSDFVRMLDDIGKFISQELDKAREEGRLSVIQELLFEPEEPSHNIGTLEAAFKYEDIIKRYSGEWRNKTGLVSPKYIKSNLLKDNK